MYVNVPKDDRCFSNKKIVPFNTVNELLVVKNKDLMSIIHILNLIENEIWKDYDKI